MYNHVSYWCTVNLNSILGFMHTFTTKEEEKDNDEKDGIRTCFDG